jgi:Tfp pilus assembly ATPase PilU
MQTMNQALLELVTNGTVSAERALSNSNLPEELERMLGKKGAAGAEHAPHFSQVGS